MSQISQIKMDHKKNLKPNNIMKRTTFFKSFGTGVISFIALKTFPFNLMNKNGMSNTKVQVKINPSAVVRNKTGDHNVR